MAACPCWGDSGDSSQHAALAKHIKWCGWEIVIATLEQLAVKNGACFKSFFNGSWQLNCPVCMLSMVRPIWGILVPLALSTLEKKTRNFELPWSTRVSRMVPHRFGAPCLQNHGPWSHRPRCPKKLLVVGYQGICTSVTSKKWSGSDKEFLAAFSRIIWTLLVVSNTRKQKNAKEQSENF